MKRIAKIFGLLFIALLLVVSASVLSFLVRGNAFREAVNASPGKCELFTIDLGSAEDIEIDHQSGIAYLSVLDRRGLVAGKNVTGTILQMGLADPAFALDKAIESQLEGFRPHGISLFVQDNGTQTLFVINHFKGIEERIEIFKKQTSDQKFIHSTTLIDPLITRPNDLVAVSETKFYIANDSGASNALERAGEMLFGFGLSPLVFFDGEKFSVVVDDLKSSGGINANNGKGLLYVGETLGKSIRVYNLAEDRSLLGMEAKIQLDSAVDNIDLDVNGDVWIANHINTLSLVRHLGNADIPAPSQVQRISFRNGGLESIQTVLENNGTLLSASSVGARYSRLLLIGSITDPNILICTIDSIDPL